jgi:hypothetical protein
VSRCRRRPAALVTSPAALVTSPGSVLPRYAAFAHARTGDKQVRSGDKPGPVRRGGGAGLTPAGSMAPLTRSPGRPRQAAAAARPASIPMATPTRPAPGMRTSDQENRYARDGCDNRGRILARTRPPHRGETVLSPLPGHLSPLPASICPHLRRSVHRRRGDKWFGRGDKWRRRGRMTVLDFLILVPAICFWNAIAFRSVVSRSYRPFRGGQLPEAGGSDR